MATYSELSSYLGNKTDRPWGNNTRVQTNPDDLAVHIRVRLHGTNIACLFENGDISLNAGGYRTHTTKERINKVLPRPWSVYQSAGVWYLRNYENDIEYIFEDGITIRPDGSVINAGVDTRREDRKLLARIKKYSTLYVDELLAGKIPQPGTGDCWGCLFVSEDNDNPLGTDHLLSHLEEDYFVPSLLVKAVNPGRVCSLTSDGIARCLDGIALDDWQASIVRQDVYKFLYEYLKTNLTSLAR